jgi:putative transposase
MVQDIEIKKCLVNLENNGLELYRGVDTFVRKYNKRNHKGIGRRKPEELYLYAA